jgi:hypothetical protein
MTSLKKALSRHTTAKPARAPLGADENLEPVPPSAAVPALDREALRQDLAKIRDENKRWFAVCAAMVVVLFIVSIVMTVVHVGEPATIKTILSAFGVSTAGLIVMMFRFWRTKSYSEMLVLLAANMDAVTMRSVVEVLIKKL